MEEGCSALGGGGWVEVVERINIFLSIVDLSNRGNKLFGCFCSTRMLFFLDHFFGTFVMKGKKVYKNNCHVGCV